MNLFEQQAANRRRTWLVMAIFVALAVFLGAGLDLFVIGQGEAFVPIGTVMALAISGGQSYWSLRRGDRAVLLSAGAVPVDELTAATDDDRLRYRQFVNTVEEMAIAGGVPPPRAYVIPDDDPNAFATGRDPQHASIAVTEGLLRLLNREELQGVVAHEMGHIRNLDIRLMTVVAALVGMLVLVSDWGMRIMRFGGTRSRSSSRSKNGGGGAIAAVVFAIWLLAVILAPFLGQLMAMAVSRSREYLADATGAQLTRNPLALAGALEKIEDAAAPTKAVKRGTAHLCISDPLGRRLDNREGWFANVFATHPPMDKRIDALKRMAYQRA